MSWDTKVVTVFPFRNIIFWWVLFLKSKTQSFSSLKDVYSELFSFSVTQNVDFWLALQRWVKKALCVGLGIYVS